MGLGELKPSNCTLQLTNRLIRTPKGQIEDVLVKIDKCFFLVDFVMLDKDPIHASMQIYVILGFPFLAASDPVINCRLGVTDVSVINMRDRLKFFKASSQSFWR